MRFSVSVMWAVDFVCLWIGPLVWVFQVVWGGFGLVFMGPLVLLVMVGWLL